MNGDGFDDLIVGAPFNNNGTFSGSARVFISVVTRHCAEQNLDGQLTPADFSAWIAAFNLGETGPTCVP